MNSATAFVHDDFVIRDDLRVRGARVPFLTLPGQDVLIVNLPPFGGTPELEQSQAIENLARQNGWTYVTRSWPDVECDQRNIYGMSVVESIYHDEALWAEAARHVTARTRKVILIGSSVAATATLRIGKNYRHCIDHIILLSPGYDIKKHMIEPLSRETDGHRWLAQKDPAYLEHIFRVPAHHPVKKRGFISRDDLRKATEFHLFDNGNRLTDMPPLTIIGGEEDPQIPKRDFVNLCDFIDIRKNERLAKPKLIMLEDAGHLFRGPQLSVLQDIVLQSAIDFSPR